MTVHLAEQTAAAEREPTGSQFTLGGLLLFITWSGLCLSALQARSVAALLALFTVAPALIRTVWMARSYRRSGDPLDARRLFALIRESLVITVLSSTTAIGLTIFAVYPIHLIDGWLGLSRNLFFLAWKTFPYLFYVAMVWRCWNSKLYR